MRGLLMALYKTAIESSKRKLTVLGRTIWIVWRAAWPLATLKALKQQVIWLVIRKKSFP